MTITGSNSGLVTLIQLSWGQQIYVAAPAAAKSLQLCLTLCNPVDVSPPGSPIPGIYVKPVQKVNSGLSWTHFRLKHTNLCSVVQEKKPNKLLRVEWMANISTVIVQRWDELGFQAAQGEAPSGDSGQGFHPWVGKIPWRRKWQPTGVFLPGKSHEQRSLEGYSPRGHTESGMTEHTHVSQLLCLKSNIS